MSQPFCMNAIFTSMVWGKDRSETNQFFNQPGPPHSHHHHHHQHQQHRWQPPQQTGIYLPITFVWLTSHVFIVYLFRRLSHVAYLLQSPCPGALSSISVFISRAFLFLASLPPLSCPPPPGPLGRTGQVCWGQLHGEGQVADYWTALGVPMHHFSLVWTGFLFAQD